MKRRLVHEVPDDQLERIAHIIGPFSAAGDALSEKRRRIALGEPHVIVMSNGSTFIVGPDPRREESQEREAAPSA